MSGGTGMGRADDVARLPPGMEAQTLVPQVEDFDGGNRGNVEERICFNRNWQRIEALEATY